MTTTPRYLLLPKAGLDPELLDELLRHSGLQRAAGDEPPQGPHTRRWTTPHEPTPSTVEYCEDALLGQRQLYLSGPRAHELAQACAVRWACTAPDQAVQLAEGAQDPIERVATLAPLAVLLAERAGPSDRARAVLSARLGDPVAVVQRAALLVAAQVPGDAGTTLLRTALAVPALAAEAERLLSARLHAEAAALPGDPPALLARAEAALAAGDALTAGYLADRILADDALASAAYLVRARVHVARAEPWPAFLDVTAALAVGRRQGVRLQAMQELQTQLHQQLVAATTPPPAHIELRAVALLTTLLHLGRLHEAEEVATALLPLPGRPALFWLAIALSRRERGRSGRAIEALEAALAGKPDLFAARFLLGECRRDLGDGEGALREFAALAPPADGPERPPPPSLLDAYADELLGAQSPWRTREHAFVRVRLLRECGRPAEALALTAALIESDPAADALLAHGILLAELGRHDEALAALDRAAAALQPAERLLGDEDPLLTIELQRAAAYTALGQAAAARAAEQRALQLGGPDQPAAAGYAALRRAAQQALLGEALDSEDGDDVVLAALRSQLAALFAAALALLDTGGDATAGRALLLRSETELAALRPLAPAWMTRRAAVLREILDAVAGALGTTATATGDPPQP